MRNLLKKLSLLYCHIFILLFILADAIITTKSNHKLNLPNIAKLYKQIGTLEGGLDELRSLHAIVVFFATRIKQPDTWTMIFDKYKH